MIPSGLNRGIIYFCIYYHSRRWPRKLVCL